jgi:hypothetical protein
VSIPQASRRRAKLSITVSRETLGFLRSRVASGQAASIGDAIDAVIERLRQLENRHRLASATERYFDQLEPNAQVKIIPLPTLWRPQLSDSVETIPAAAAYNSIALASSRR